MRLKQPSKLEFLIAATTIEVFGFHFTKKAPYSWAASTSRAILAKQYLTSWTAVGNAGRASAIARARFVGTRHIRNRRPWATTAAAALREYGSRQTECYRQLDEAMLGCH